MLGAIRLQKRNVALRAFFVLIPSPGLFGLLLFVLVVLFLKWLPLLTLTCRGWVGSHFISASYEEGSLRIFFGYGHGSMIFFGVLPDSQ